MDNKYTPEFIDQSWESMSQLLDKEMPKKKRRILPIFFILGTILLLVTAFFAYSSLTKNTEDSSLVASTQNAIDSDINNSLNATASKDQNTLANASPVSEKSLDTKEAPITETVNNKKITSSIYEEKSLVSTPSMDMSFNSGSKNTQRSIVSESAAVVLKELPVYKAEDFIQTSEDILSSDKEILITNQNHTKVTNKHLIDSQISRYTDALSFLNSDINLLLLGNRQLPVLSPIIFSSPAVKVKSVLDRWSFGIGAAYASNFEQNIKGPGLVARADFNLSNSWAIESSLGIFRHSVTAQEIALEDANKIISNSDMNDDESEIADQEFNRENISTYLSNVKTQTQIVSSLGIKKSFTSKIYVSAGAKNRYTIARAIDPILLDGTNIGASSDTMDQLSADKFLRDQFFSAYVGIGYNPLKNLSFRIETDFSIQSYLKAPSSAILNRRTSFVQAEMAYRF